MEAKQIPAATRVLLGCLALFMAQSLLPADVARPDTPSDTVFPEFKWDPVTERDWNTDLTWLNEPCDAVMLFDKVIDDERVVYFQVLNQRVYRRTRVLTEQGRLASDIKFTYNPHGDCLAELRARTVLRDGRVFELTKEDILKTAREIEDGGGAKEVCFSFPHADSDCIVEYTVGFKLDIPNTVFTYRDVQVQKDIPLAMGEYTWYFADPEGPDDTYADLGFPQSVWSGPYPEIIASTTNERSEDVLKQVVRNVPAWHDEPMSLPEAATRLQIWRYYCMHDPKVELANIAESYQHPEPNSYDFGEKDIKAIHEATERFRGLGGQSEVVRAVYSWLQDSIVNVSYCHRPPRWLTELRGRKFKKFSRHDHLRDVLKSRYGNWLDIDCLFYRMLRDLNVEAWPVLVARRDERLFNDKAGFFQFERFVIAVPDNYGGYTYCSPGEYGLPFGELHWAIQDTDALLCNNGPTTLHIPPSPPDRSKAVRVFALGVTADGSVEGTLTERHCGHKGRLCRLFSVGEEPENVKKMLADSLAQLLPGATGTVDDVNLESAFGEPVEIRYSLRYSPQPAGDSTDTWLAPLQYAPDTGNIFTTPRRYGEIVFDRAYHAIDTVQISLPDQQLIAALPRDTSVVTGAGSCTVSFATAGNRVVAVRDFVLNQPRYSAAEYPAVQELFAARSALSRSRVELILREK